MTEHRQTAGWAAQRGFTLLELLVSMTIIALLAATILFGWRIAAAAWGRANEVVSQQRRTAAVQQVLVRQMAGITPVFPRLQEGNANIFFQGSGRTARFVSRYSLANRSRAGLTLIEYQIAEAGSGAFQLLLKETPVRNLAELELPGGSETAAASRPFVELLESQQTQVLLDGLREARLEYYRPAGPQGPGGWTSDWRPQGGQLPRAMAIRLNPPEEDGPLRPVSVIAVIENYSAVRR